MMPPKTLPISFDKRITVLRVRVSPSELQSLERLAARHALTLSEAVRLALVDATSFAQVQP